MTHPFELTFKNVLGTYNAFWELSGKIAADTKIGNPDNWILTFREGLRGMLARIIAVDREYARLHEFQSEADAEAGNPNEWAVLCESHAAVIFFGIDSSVECFVFALNAIGFVKDRGGFCDITDAKALRQIGPKNILGGDVTDKRNPKAGYAKLFPRVVHHFTTQKAFLSAVFEYHDVSKHRSSVATGGGIGTLHVSDSPKQPGARMSSAVHTLESLAHDFQRFVDELLPIALEETAAAFGCSVTKREVGS